MDKDESTNVTLEVDLQLEELILLANELLNDLIQEEGYHCESIFNSESVPAIKMDAYLRRIHRITKFSPQCLIIGIIYLDRYNLAEPEFCLNWNNVHRVFLTCLIMAAKFQDDVIFDNWTFSKAGGIPPLQLMMFEMEIFSKLGFSGFVSDEEYENLVEKLYSVYGDVDQ